MKHVVTVVTLMMALGCGNESEQRSTHTKKKDTVIGVTGGRTPIAPWKNRVAALVRGSFTGNSLCSGTILSNSWILTASHCIGNHPFAKDYKVYFGANVRTAKSRQVVKIAIGESASSFGCAGTGVSCRGKDIAMVKFSGGLPAGYAKANLPSNPDRLAWYQKLEVLGYGKYSATNNGGLWLRQGTEKIVPKGTNNAYREMGTKGVGGTQACNGDSGGGYFLQSKPTVVAVVSRGETSCTAGTITTRVAMWLPWIKATLRK